MGKRKNTRKKSSARAEGGATRTNNYSCVGGGGSASKNDKFAAFNFTDDDERVEIESRKTLAKFGPKSPSKKPVHNRQSIDKYTFLQSFARGPHTDFGNDTGNVDLTESGFQDKTFGTDTISLGSLKYEPQRSSFSKFLDSEYSCGEKSCAQRSKRPECYTAGKEHNKIFCVDSSEDGDMEFRSSSSINLAENEGSLNDCSSEYDADSNDCETVVAVAPNYVKYGETCYTRCLLTFSQKCIRLKGSPLRDKNRTHCLEWSTSDVSNIECQQCESVKADVVNIHMKSNVTNVEDWNSGSVELEIAILDDPQWSKKQEEIKSLDPKLRAAWKINASDCSFKESFEDLVYPDGDPDAVFISRRDIDLLQPGTFINDTIIDFYFKYLSDKIRTEERHRFHFFNTFFFQKLDALRRDSSGAGEGGDFFQSVRKWTRNVNIFETDYIFIPVNFSLHWSLIIICHPGEVAYLRDKVTDESPTVPCILHMDSIRGSHRGLEMLIRRYLLEEWKERGNKHDRDIGMKFLNMEFVSLQLPQQENWFDCGLFLLHYAELFLEQASNFSTTDFFDNLNQDWFLPAEVSLRKRDHIRKLIHRIVEDNALKDPPADKCFQSGGIDEGDSCVRLMEKESCCGVELESSDDHIKGQQSPVAMLEERSSDKSAIDKFYQPYKLAMPIHQFSNLSLPMEQDTSLNGDTTSKCHFDTPMPTRSQATSLNGDTTSKCHFDTPMPPRCRRINDFKFEKMKDSLKTSKTRSDASLIMIDCGPEVGEDLASCIVEDSEDESGSESTPRIRPSPFKNSPLRFHI